MNPIPENHLYRVHCLLNTFYTGDQWVSYPDDDTGESSRYGLSEQYIAELKFLRGMLLDITYGDVVGNND